MATSDASLQPGLLLRRRAHAVRALRRRAGGRPHRRSRRRAAARPAGTQSLRGLGRARRRDPRLREPGGRGQPQRRADGAAARRAARPRARRDGQPPVRVQPRRLHHRRPGDRGGGDVARDCRRRREHVAGAVRDGQAGRGLRPRPGLGRHHARLALRQPADAGAIRHRLDARDRRARRRRARHRPRRSGSRSRCAASSGPARRRPPDCSPARSSRSPSHDQRARRSKSPPTSTRGPRPPSSRSRSSSRSSTRAARSRPATPRASTTAAARCCSRRRPRCGRTA